MKERVGTFNGVDIFTDDTKYVMVKVGDLNAVWADARRYRWLRTAGAWESEIGMDSMTPEQFDARVDAEIEAETRHTITPKGRKMLEGK